jgi:predicted dehydrogenase
MINLLRWYLGEIVSIKSHLSHRFNLDLEDSAICLAEFDSGTLATLSVGWFSQDYRLSVELFGTVKHANSGSTPQSPLVPRIVNTLVQGTSKMHWPFLAELRYFVNCVAHDMDPSPSGENGLKDIEAISLAYQNEIELSEDHSQVGKALLGF